MRGLCRSIRERTRVELEGGTLGTSRLYTLGGDRPRSRFPASCSSTMQPPCPLCQFIA